MNAKDFKLTILEMEIAEKDSKIKEAEKNSEDLKTQLSDQEKKLDDIMTSHSNLSAQLKTKEDWIEEANETMNEYRKDIDKQAAEIKEKASLILTGGQKLDYETTLNAGLSEQLKSKTEFLGRAHKYVEDFKIANANLYSDGQLKDRKINMQQEQLNEALNANANIYANNQEMDGIIFRLQNQLSESAFDKNRIEELESKLKTSKRTNSELYSDIRSKDAKIRKIEEKLDAKRDKIEDLKEKIEELEEDSDNSYY